MMMLRIILCFLVLAIAVPASALTLFDDFNDGNLTGWTASGTGQNWTAADNYAKETNATSDHRFLMSNTTKSGSQRVQSKVAVHFGGASYYHAGIVIKANAASSPASYYVCTWVYSGGPALKLYKLVSGTPTELGTSSQSISWDTWYTMECRFDAATNGVSLWWEGSERITATDSTHASNTYWGFHKYDGEVRYDDVYYDDVDVATYSYTMVGGGIGGGAADIATETVGPQTYSYTMSGGGIGGGAAGLLTEVQFSMTGGGIGGGSAVITTPGTKKIIIRR